MPSNEEPSNDSERRYPRLSPEAKERVLENVRMSLVWDRVVRDRMRRGLPPLPPRRTSSAQHRLSEPREG